MNRSSIQKTIDDLEGQVAQKTAEINESREKYYSLLNAMDGIAWEADAETCRYSFVTKQAERLLGFPVEAWQEPGFWEKHLHPSDREYALNFRLQHTKEKKPHEFEYRMIAADGRIIWLRDIVSFDLKEDKVAGLKGLMIDITRSKAAEEILKESEEKHRTLIEQAGDSIIIFDDKGNILETNKSSLDLLGYKENEYQDKKLWDFIFLEDLERQPFRFDELNRGESTITRRRLKKKDGTAVETEIHAKKLSDGRYLGMARDLSVARKAEEAIRQSEERYRTLVENAPEALVVFDVEKKRFVSVSESAIRLFKMSRTELLEIGPAELSPEFQPDGLASSDLILKYLGKAIAGEKPVFEWTHCDSDGQLIPCEVWLVRLPSPNQILIRGSVIDITERKKAEAIIKESEAKFRAFFESSMDGFLLTSPDGKILMANPAACAIFGRTEEEICKLGRDGIADITDSNLTKLLEERKRFGKAKGELRMIRKDGSIFPVEVSSSIFTDAYERERTSMIIRDITERKKFEKQVQDSFLEIRQLTDYLQNIRENERSHIAREIHDELGQQLTALKMDVSWLTNKLKSEDQQANQKLAHLAVMLDNTVKTVRRISSELRPSLLDDLGLVAAMDWHLHEFGRSSGIKTHFKDPGKDLYLPEAIKTGLFRIFQESLTNVARHAEAKKVKVVLAEFPKHLSLKIEDDGKGFDLAFTPNQRTLGLLGMKERTSMIGGNYKIKSDIGKGTVVEVTVPYELKTKEQLINIE